MMMSSKLKEELGPPVTTTDALAESISRLRRMNPPVRLSAVYGAVGVVAA
jgi:hypothetical protein